MKIFDTTTQTGIVDATGCILVLIGAILYIAYRVVIKRAVRFQNLREIAFGVLSVGLLLCSIAAFLTAEGALNFSLAAAFTLLTCSVVFLWFGAKSQNEKMQIGLRFARFFALICLVVILILTAINAVDILVNKE